MPALLPIKSALNWVPLFHTAVALPRLWVRRPGSLPLFSCDDLKLFSNTCPKSVQVMSSVCVCGKPANNPGLGGLDMKTASSVGIGEALSAYLSLHQPATLSERDSFSHM